VPGTINATNIANNCNTKTLKFSDSINNISTTTFSYLSGVSSNIQTQINNTNNSLSTVEYRTRDISWTYGANNMTTIANFCNTSILSFSQSLNNISTTTFSYLSGLTSNIQNQINALANTNPPGSIIAFAGSSNSLSGYLPCDGQIYNSQNYNALFNAIGTIYGDAGNGNFCVPDYRGIFLRGLGTRFVAAQVIGGNQGAPVGRNYTSPDLGIAKCDQSIQTTVNNYSLNQQVKAFVTGGTASFNPNYSFQFSNAVASEALDITTDFTNYGNTETFPAHISVQYFIKY
jgi:microcystin-dependent protein